MYLDNTVEVILLWQSKNSLDDVLKFLKKVGKCSYRNERLNLNITILETYDYESLLQQLFDCEDVRTVLIFEKQFYSQVKKDLEYISCWIFQIEVIKDLVNLEYYFTSFRLNSYSSRETDLVITKFGQQAASYSY